MAQQTTTPNDQHHPFPPIIATPSRGCLHPLSFKSSAQAAVADRSSVRALSMDKGYRLHVYKHLHLVCFDENPCRDKKQLARRIGLVQKDFRYLQRSGTLVTCQV
jgi:hypothetical protein